MRVAIPESNVKFNTLNLQYSTYNEKYFTGPIHIISSDMRFSEYRIMWILVFYDLPTETIQERRIHAEFRKGIMRQGFTMFQFSIYTKHCSSREQAEVQIKRIKNLIPEKGKIGILSITDKQFGMMEVYHGVKKIKTPESLGQLTMF